MPPFRLPPSSTAAAVRAALVAITIIAALAAAGCAGIPRKTTAPIPARWSTPLGAARTADTLIVFLPGRADRPKDFETRGFVAELVSAGVRADWVAVDAHLGYYWKRTVVDRLVEDVVAPARARGYRRIVAVGISLGGLGALLAERDRPATFDALVLVAPYLGDDRRLFAAIDAAGGPGAWARGRDPRSGKVDEQLWTFLGTRSAALPPTWLAFGTSDEFAPGHRVLAALLPPGRVLARDGAHDWKTWRELWRELGGDRELFATGREPTPPPH